MVQSILVIVKPVFVIAKSVFSYCQINIRYNMNDENLKKKHSRKRYFVFLFQTFKVMTWNNQIQGI